MKHLERALDGQNQFWKYLVNVIVGFLASNLVGAIPLMAVIFYQKAHSKVAITPNPDNISDLSMYGISPNFGLFLMILPFVFGLLGIVLMLKPLHKRRFSEVVNGTSSIRWHRFFVGAGVWGGLLLLTLVGDYLFYPSSYTFHFNFSLFIPLVLISVLLIPFQTTFEELLFRGYFGQAIAAWTKNRWLVVLLPAVLFALMHVANPEVKAYGFWLAMPQYLLFGLLFGLTTVLDDGIEISMGAHAANNILSSILVTSSSSVLQTPALFTQTNISPLKDTFILFFASCVLLYFLTVRYNWSWSILNKRVEVNPIVEVEKN